jgi:hypothetical protein
MQTHLCTRRHHSHAHAKWADTDAHAHTRTGAHEHHRAGQLHIERHAKGDAHKRRCLLTLAYELAHHGVAFGSILSHFAGITLRLHLSERELPRILLLCRLPRRSGLGTVVVQMPKARSARTCLKRPPCPCWPLAALHLSGIHTQATHGPCEVCGHLVRTRTKRIGVLQLGQCLRTSQFHCLRLSTRGIGM